MASNLKLQPRREYHIVVLGAGGVGKSCLTAQFVQNVWIESYDPTIEDSYRKLIEVDVSVTTTTFAAPPALGQIHTAGTEQFTAMRELYMKQGQGFLLVFSITSMSSLNELAELREQIIRIKDDENVPIVIVGNKSDLEEDRVVSRSRAFALSQQWGNSPYYETSARRRANVNEVFVDLCRQIIRKDLLASQERSMELSMNGRNGGVGVGVGGAGGDGQGKNGRLRGHRKRGRGKGDCVIL
ncbi:Ras- protein rsr1 [Onygenales sp. PD_40]|nr:Ras- protein rsr1 [Onygenales sp. PD_40]